MNRTLIHSGDQDEALQQLMVEILKGAKTKLVEPILTESKGLAGLVGDLHIKDQKELEEIKARLGRLEEAVQAAPVLLLSAIKEAINQAGTVEKE